MLVTMSDQMELSAEQRSVTGKQVKRLRQQGLVPAVLCGHNVESVPVQVRRDELAQLLRRSGRTAIVQLNDLGTSIRVSDLQPPPTVTIRNPADEVIVSVAAVQREAVEAEAAEEAEEAPEKANESGEAREGMVQEGGQMGLQSGSASLPASRHVGRKLAAQQELRPPIVLPTPQRHCDPNAEPWRPSRSE